MKRSVLFLMVSVLLLSAVFCEKSKVYFTSGITAEGAWKVFQKIREGVKGNSVGLKVHFGEKGNKWFIKPEISRKLVQKLALTYVETNVLYRSPRQKTEDHIKLAKEHGFTYGPIDILDSEGMDTYEVKMKHLDKFYVGKDLKRYDTIIVFSHFKGHGYAGFGGAIKNVSMGLAPPKGKLDMHSGASPIYDNELCIKCNRCVEKCPKDAITINPLKIDKEKCIACGDCASVCPVGAIRAHSRSEQHIYFLEKLSEYAKVLSDKNNFVYINVIANVSRYCDCSSRAPEPFIDDIGILASTDIVAIDQACHDLVDKAHGSDDAFLKENKLSGKHQLKYAEEIGLGSRTYELIELK